MLFFLHIPKCGGTTVKQLFYSAFGSPGCLKVWDTRFGADVSPQNFAKVESRLLASKEVIMGHLPFSEMLANDYTKDLYEQDKLKILTVVRDPIDRIVSLLNYVKANQKHPKHARVNHLDPVVFIFNQGKNQQHKFLQAYKEESFESICSRIAVFPLENSEHNTRQWLEKTAGISTKPVAKANVTADSFPDATLFKRTDLSPSQLTELEEKHALDYQLYVYCKQNNPLVKC